MTTTYNDATAVTRDDRNRACSLCVMLVWIPMQHHTATTRTVYIRAQPRLGVAHCLTVDQEEYAIIEAGTNRERDLGEEMMVVACYSPSCVQ